MKPEEKENLLGIYQILCQQGHADLADALLNQSILKDRLDQEDVDLYLTASEMKRKMGAS